jgi:hypothetical protein
MAELLRQGRRNPLLIHLGPTPPTAEETTPIVGMAACPDTATIIVAAVNGDERPDPASGTARTGGRHDTTVYLDLGAGRSSFLAWFPDPALARRVVDALNGTGEDCG